MRSSQNSPLHKVYFKWLCDPVAWKGLTSLETQQFELMHRTEFEYFIPNDRNRALDGVRLRSEFLDGHPEFEFSHGVEDWLESECSVLEMLWALSGRMEYQTGLGAAQWFSRMMENLGVGYGHDSEDLARAMFRLNKRAYSYNGDGGLFPLKHPMEDQRKVELWYQMGAYIMENDEWRGNA